MSQPTSSTSYEALYAEYFPRLVRFLTRQTGNFALAEDIAQDTLLTVWQDPATLDGSKDPWPWLRTVGRRKAIDAARARSRRQRILAATIDPRVLHGTGSPSDQVDERQTLVRALESVPARQRTALGLRHVVGLTRQQRIGRARHPRRQRAEQRADGEPAPADRVPHRVRRAATAGAGGHLVRSGRVAAVALAVGLTASLAPTALAQSPTRCAPGDGDPDTVTRIAIDDPVELAAEVSRRRYPPTGDPFRCFDPFHVVLTRHDEYVDALFGVPLTGDGPLLYTDRDKLPLATRSELLRLFPAPLGRTAYLIGGQAAIGAEVEGELDDIGFTVKRLAGPTRLETAIAVADEVIEWAGDVTVLSVVLARGSGPPHNPQQAWADAIAVGPYAAWDVVPILPVVEPFDRLDPAVADTLERYGTDRTVIVGGPAALPTALDAQVPGPRRVFGPTRAGTAVQARGIYSAPGRLFVVNGYQDDSWAFALAVAGWGGSQHASLVLTQTHVLPVETADEIRHHCDDDTSERNDLIVIGTEARVSQAVVDQMQELQAPC